MAASSNVVNTIAEKLYWPVGQSAIRHLTLDGVAGCEIYDAYDRRVLDGASVGVARIDDIERWAKAVGGMPGYLRSARHHRVALAKATPAHDSSR